MSNVPSSTGIGAPGTQPAPANLSRSPMAATPGQQAASAVPFVRGSSIATYQDYNNSSITAGSTTQIQLQTNAFLSHYIMDFELTTSGNSAAVAYAADAPFNVIQSIKLDDPAGQSIIAPITGYQLYTLNKYLPDTGCAFDPQQDPNYLATAGTVATGGTFSFRLVLPIEHRARDAFGAVNNSAANQRYLLTLQTISTYGGTTGLYTTAPTTPATNLSLTCTQVYWTSPPASIQTSSGAVPVQPTPSGLGTVGFVRFEQHKEVSGGGTPQIQLNNVGDFLSSILLTLRNSSNAREGTDWPSPFQWWVNDFQVHNLYINVWQRWMAKVYQYKNAIGTAGGLDTGVFVIPMLNGGLFDKVENYEPASQYLATDATSKLQVRGSNFGSGASTLEVVTRVIRPVSGATLFA